MESSIIAVIAIATIILLICIITYSQERAERKQSLAELEANEASYIFKERAAVSKKDFYVENTGSVKNPGHECMYIVIFTLDGGAQKEMAVFKEDFERLEIGAYGILITEKKTFCSRDGVRLAQYDCFVAFEKKID